MHVANREVCCIAEFDAAEADPAAVAGIATCASFLITNYPGNFEAFPEVGGVLLRQGGEPVKGRHHLPGLNRVRIFGLPSVTRLMITCPGAETACELEKPYSGKFVVRVAPTDHGKAALAAAKLGMSLNKFVEKALQDEAALVLG